MRGGVKRYVGVFGGRGGVNFEGVERAGSTD